MFKNLTESQVYPRFRVLYYVNVHISIPLSFFGKVPEGTKYINIRGVARALPGARTPECQIEDKNEEWLRKNEIMIIIIIKKKKKIQKMMEI